ncbi:MAG TPA: penicillin acylase family protein [Solirubrobacterales bacterium]|nr:penicillin acylase family protein [Solirubrobacterales bacterium]
MGYGRSRRESPRARAVVVASLFAVLAALVLAIAPRAHAAATATLAAAPGAGPLEANIRRDQHGIPNIIGQNFADVGFGYGYSIAQDNICELAESYVTVRGERSRYTGEGVQGSFGPDGSYLQRGNGFSANNLNSDFFYQRIIDDRTVEKLLDRPPPDGPMAEIREGVRGYVAGYNKYLADTGVRNLPDPRCRGAAWVKPITEMDAYRRFYQLALLASQTVAIDGIADEKTPGGASLPIDPGQIAGGLAANLKPPIGSNAVALGSEATANGKGMMLGNPHFPWDGPERFYQAHLMIPGRVNVSGGSLYGVPLVLIGHTDNLAWSHTVSTAFRFTPFQEVINPLNATQYLYDGSWRDMGQEQVTVQVHTDSGLEPRTRTLYSTLHGPVMDSLSGIPLPWTRVTAFTMGDVNAANFRYLNHFFFVNQAQSVAELDEIERRYEGIPWVNTIAADSAGKAYYADIGAIPNVSNQKAAQCNTPVGAATFQLLGLPVLNGSTSACEWDDDPDAAAPGIFGPSHLPSLIRDDYVTNSNDSYWLSNPAHPLEGFARIIGDERTPRTLRTRLGLRIVQQRLDGTDGLAGGLFTRQQLQDAVFNDRQFAGELWRDQLVSLCERAPGGYLVGSSGPVDVSDACPVLAAWDLHDNLDSNGAILFRRFATRALATPGGLPLNSPTGDLSVFSTPFDPNNPVNTPAGLNTASPKVQSALADAVTDLRDAGIPLDAPLRGYQYERRGDEKIPIHGGPGDPNGDFNAINVSWSGDPAEPGYPDVPHGSSFVMVTSFTGGCPDDRSILTYSQSENPASPYFADQTRMFSRKEWVDPPFCAAEVTGDPTLSNEVIRGGKKRR